jgi:arylsulfatase A-like enzyme
MKQRPNVIILAIDSLRADHLGSYGYHRATSPSIDAFGTEGVTIDRFMCAGLPTHPSFTTLYTGQHPITHEIVSHGPRNALGRNAPFLPQLFLANGYTTCALDNLAQGRIWFRRGFEYYIDPSMRHTLFCDVSCEELNARAIPWLRQHADESFFMLIHYWDPHWPFKPPARYRDLFYSGNPTDPSNRALDAWWQNPLGAVARDTWMRRPDGLVTDPEYVVALYDQEIRHVDDGIAELLGALEMLELAEDTIVVLLGDHGESLAEHRIFFDHHGLYDNTLHVPFMVRWPGRVPAGVRLPQMLQHHDIAPTLLEAAGIPVPPEMDGRSFLRLLTAETSAGGRDRIVSCECTWQAKWSLRTDRHKLILARSPDIYGNPERELYDLEADPAEERNLAEQETVLAKALEEELEAWIGSRLAALGRADDPLRKHGISLNFG